MAERSVGRDKAAFWCRESWVPMTGLEGESERPRHHLCQPHASDTMTATEGWADLSCPACKSCGLTAGEFPWQTPRSHRGPDSWRTAHPCPS